LVTLLTALGFERKRVSGSHQVFKHPDVNELVTLQPDQNGKAKAYQVRQVLKMIEEYNLRLESDQETDRQSSDKDGDK